MRLKEAKLMTRRGSVTEAKAGGWSLSHNDCLAVLYQALFLLGSQFTFTIARCQTGFTRLLCRRPGGNALGRSLQLLAARRGTAPTRSGNTQQKAVIRRAELELGVLPSESGTDLWSELAS